MRFFWIVFYFLKDLFTGTDKETGLGKTGLVIRYARCAGLKVVKIKMPPPRRLEGQDYIGLPTLKNEKPTK